MKELTAQDWIRRLVRYAMKYRGRVILTLSGSVAAMAATASIPLIQRAIVDDAILSSRAAVWKLATALVIAAVVNYTASFIRRNQGGRLSLDVQHDLRTDVFAALSTLDGKRQDDLSTGQVISRATTDITMVQGLLGLMPIMIGNVLLFVLSIVVMLTLSPLLTLVAIAVAPALWWVARRSRSKLFPATWEAQQQSGMVAGTVNDAVTGVRVVKGFGQEAQELDKVSRGAQRLYASRLRAVRFTSRYNPALQAIPALGQVGVLALGGWLAVRGSISLGTFLAFSTYLAQLVAPVRMLSNLLTVGQQARASVVRVLELADAVPALHESPSAVALPDGAAPRVELDDVSFGYRDDRTVLDGLSLCIAPGETVAVIGGAGSGKTSLAMLIARFYDVNAGAVRVDGHDVRDLTLPSLRSAIGLVMEDSFLFSTSVRDNIAYGRPDATFEEIVEAARTAQAHEFILALPKGYDTVVGEQGLTLSGGQRQRVCLARAVLTDPRILVLDDATSAVDARVESAIFAGLRDVTSSRTTLLIAHRYSTLTLADRIAVLDKGRVADTGTHEELWARCPLYRRLLAGPEARIPGAERRVRLPTSFAVQADLDEPTADDAPDGGVTASLWASDADADDSPYRASGDPTAGAVPTFSGTMGRRAGAGGGGAGTLTGALAGVPPTPELLAQVAKLPPAVGTPEVDEERVRAAEPHFTLGRLVRPLAVPLIAAGVLVALDAGASLVMPVLTRQGVDAGVEHHDARVIAMVALIGLLVTAVDLGINVRQTMLAGRTGERLLYTLRVKTFAHLQRLGLDYYERELSGRIMTRMTTDVDAFSTFLQTGLTTATVSALTWVGVLGALFVMNVELALVVLTTMPVMFAATFVFRAASAKAYSEARDRISAVHADLQENVAGMRVVQAYRRERHNAAQFAARSAAYRSSRGRAQTYISVYFPFVQLLSYVAAALVLVVGGRMVSRGTLTAGALIAFLLYIDLFFSPIQQLSQIFDSYQQAAVGLRRVRDLLRTPTTTPAAAEALPVPPRLTGEVQFVDVGFRYSPDAPDALRAVSLRVRAGETVALVGETGAGKSTMVKLVARFYDATGGGVLVDGVDVRDYDLAAYRHRLGVVPQEAYLFPGTVRDAIAYGRPDATPAQIEAAARAVGAHPMIAQLAGGYLHQVGERGRNLSSGQRQLLALARAELVEPDILLMDEATAALDLATEAEVTRAAARLARRRTTLVVAHRLTTAARADRIAVLDHGELVELGSHAELLARDGLYATQWRAFIGETPSVTSAGSRS